MFTDERLFALVPFGDAHVLIDAACVREIAPAPRATATEELCVDLASALDMPTPLERHALSVDVGSRLVWLLVEPGTRLVRLPSRTVSAMPAWLPRALVPSLAPVGEGFGFELNLHALLERVHATLEGSGDEPADG